MISPKEIWVYQRPDGSSPFQDWLTHLRDLKGAQVILTRIDRLALGNAGNCRSLGEGLWELKIYFGPGYRVYFGFHGSTIVILMNGGDKTSQWRDISKSRKYWKDYWRVNP